jgi:hypothetical protein
MSTCSEKTKAYKLGILTKLHFFDAGSFFSSTASARKKNIRPS